MSILSESRFHMWRAVTAMIHVDGVVTPHEVNFIVNNVLALPLTDEQRGTIKDDLSTPVDPRELYKKITYRKDMDDFFRLARAISWSDGVLDEDEAAVLEKLFDLPFQQRGQETFPQETEDSDVASFIRKLLSGKSGQ